MFGRIKINKNWSKRYDKELLQLFGDLDIITHIFQTKSGWIGLVMSIEWIVIEK